MNAKFKLFGPLSNVVLTAESKKNVKEKFKLFIIHQEKVWEAKNFDRSINMIVKFFILRIKQVIN